MQAAVGQPIRILIIDDHSIVSPSLRFLLETKLSLKVVGEVSKGCDAFLVTRDSHPDIILLDLDPGDASGLDLLPKLLSVAPQARVVVITGVRDPEIHCRAVRLDAMDLVVKNEETDVLLQAIAKVHAGKVWLDRKLLGSVLGEITRSGTVKPVDPKMLKIATVTPCELQVIALVGLGYRNRQVADHLCIAEATVRHHLTSNFTKLGVPDRLELYFARTSLRLVESPVIEEASWSRRLLW